MLGATALGYYVLAFNLASWPVSPCSPSLCAASRQRYSPACSTTATAMTNSLRSIIGLLAAVTIPICLLLAGAAEPVIGFVYGEVWAPAAPVLTWLAILAAFRIFFELAYDYLVVLGRSSIIFTVQLVWLASSSPACCSVRPCGGWRGWRRFRSSSLRVLWSRSTSGSSTSRDCCQRSRQTCTAAVGAGFWSA